MEIKGFKFDRNELAGALGDLGVMLPLLVGMISITGLDAATSLVCVGAFYTLAGLYFRLPIPVQPLKLVAALAIASPERFGPEVVAATGIVFGALLLVMAWTGMIDLVAKLFTKRVVRGVQAGIGLLLAVQGVGLIAQKEMFFSGSNPAVLGTFPINQTIGVAGALVALLLLSSKKIPAALALVVGGVAVGFIFAPVDAHIGAAAQTASSFTIPSTNAFITAFIYLALPQLPLTLGNSIIGVKDAVCAMFTPEESGKATNRAFATSVGLANVFAGALGGMPMCHGAGGLAAHHRFGARTGGANIMIGVIFIALGLVFGHSSLQMLGVIPNGILGALLLFAGIEMTLLIMDVREKGELFIVFLIAAVSISTKNMALAFAAGMVADFFIQRGYVKI